MGEISWRFERIDSWGPRATPGAVPGLGITTAVMETKPCLQEAFNLQAVPSQEFGGGGQEWRLLFRDRGKTGIQ